MSAKRPKDDEAQRTPEDVADDETRRSPEDAADDEVQRPPKDAAGADKRLTDAERAALLREQLKRLRVADVADEIMISLVTLGYQKLGLTSETLEMRDLADARLAIDLLRAMLDVLARERGATEVRDFRSTVAQMQLNYARAASEEAAASKAGGGASATGKTASVAGKGPADGEAAAGGEAAPDDAAAPDGEAPAGT